MSDKKIMKKYLLAASLTALVVNITFVKQTLAGTLAAPPEVTLYAAGSLRGALSEVASAFVCTRLEEILEVRHLSYWQVRVGGSSLIFH